MSDREARDAAATLEIHDLAGGGRGVAHDASGRVWLVANALPGERVVAEPTANRSGVVFARVVARSSDAHPARLPTACPHAIDCGGCDWSEVDATRGARLKASVAAGAARGHQELAARLAEAPVQPSPSAYRLRARLHWDPGSRRLGFFARRSHQVAEMSHCRVVTPRLAAARPVLEAELRARCPAPVDLEWLEDLAGDRGVAALRPARDGPASIEPDWMPSRDACARVVDGLRSLSRMGAQLEGWGHGAVEMTLPVPLTVPVGCFFQGNRHLVPWLFGRVAELSGTEPVVDLHAGVGFLGAACYAAHPRRLELVEPNRPAAVAARDNLPDAHVAVGRTAETWLARHRRLPREALAIIDPPRAGLSRELRRRLGAWRPARILSLACDPATWARDSSFLLGHGYRLRSLELVDLFPHTHHVEVLSLLELG